MIQFDMPYRSKVCKKCGDKKREDQFHKAYQRADESWLRMTICKACSVDKARQYYADHPEKHPALARKQKERRDTGLDVLTVRASRLKRKYGLSLEDYDRLLEEQGGRCPICGTDTPGWPSVENGFWPVDHNHKTGAVRGLPCNTCNRVLGMFGDDPARFEAAAQYLRRSGA